MREHAAQVVWRCGGCRETFFSTTDACPKDLCKLMKSSTRQAAVDKFLDRIREQLPKSVSTFEATASGERPQTLTSALVCRILLSPHKRTHRGLISDEWVLDSESGNTCCQEVEDGLLKANHLVLDESMQEESADPLPPIINALPAITNTSIDEPMEEETTDLLPPIIPTLPATDTPALTLSPPPSPPSTPSRTCARTPWWSPPLSRHLN